MCACGEEERAIAKTQPRWSGQGQIKVDDQSEGVGEINMFKIGIHQNW